MKLQVTKARCAQLKATLGVTGIQQVAKFIFTTSTGTAVIEFIPVDNAGPGYTHRVAFNGTLTRKYLSADYNPTEGAALDMFDMIVAETVAGKSVL